MKGLVRKGWFWIVMGFAVINVVGLLKIMWIVESSVPRLRILSFSPEGEVDTDAAVTVRFERAMIEKGKVGSAADVHYLRLKPSVKGALRWADTRTLRFEPEEALAPATQYTARVLGSATSLDGLSLRRTAVFSFRTPQLTLQEIQQTGFSDDRRLSLAFEFNQPVDPEELAQHVRLTTPKKKTIAYSVETSFAHRTIKITTAALEKDTLLVKVASGLKGMREPLELQVDVERTVTIERGLTVTDVDAYVYSSERPYIRVKFSNSVDPKGAARYIRTEPEVPLTATTRYYGLQLTGRFLPGKRYKIVFARGLTAENGTSLRDDVTRTVAVPDLPSALRFRTRGIYLAGEGNCVVPIETVNVSVIELAVEQVYGNNIVHYMREFQRYSPPSDLSRNVVTNTYPVRSEPNAHVTEHVDLRELLGEAPRGVYLLTAREPEQGYSRRRQLVVITDLGIAVKKCASELLIWVNALSTAEPVQGATVRAYTRANQMTLESVTDARGLAHFEDVDWSGDREPFAVVVTRKDDTAFIVLARSEVDRSAFDVGGRPWLRGGSEAFLYSDRGIYRPGESAHVRAVVRKRGPALPGQFPVRFRIVRPDGRTFKEYHTALSEWGTAEATVALPSHAMTGRYTGNLFSPASDQSIGTYEFQVEEFVPDRMKVEILGEEGRRQAGEKVTFTVKAAHFFGAPAAGRTVKARCRFVPERFRHAEWKSYQFGDESRDFTVVRKELGEVTLDAKGEGTFAVEIPAELKPPSALGLGFTASVKEVGGRAVTAAAYRNVDVYPRYIGVARPNTGYAEIGQEERIECVVVRPDGAKAPSAELEVSVYRILWHTVLKRDDSGRYRYRSEREEKLVAESAYPVRDGAGTVKITPEEVGQYLVRFGDPKTGAASSLTFYCSGSGFAPWSMEKPDTVELAADKASYAANDTAAILIKSPFPGRVLLTLETDGIRLVRTFRMASNTETVMVPLEGTRDPNVYCTVTVIRSVDADARWTVHRAFGAIPLTMDREPQRLHVQLDAPEETRPGKTMNIAIEVLDAAGGGRQAEVTLAAVDEGVCRLTGYESPNPWSFFYGKRRLDVATSDIYGLLMPEVEKIKAGADSETGGGGGPEMDQRLLNPIAVERVKPVALWKSNITTDASGRAEVTLDVPEFTGELRLMVVAAGADQFGMGEEHVAVRQPLMIRATFPRFLSPRDEFVVPVVVFNNTPAAGVVQLLVEGDDGIEFLSGTAPEIEVSQGGEGTVRLRARAPQLPGSVEVRVTATLGLETAVRKVEMAVRPPSTLRTVSGSGAIQAGTTGRIQLPGGWVAGTEKFRLSLTSLPHVKLGASLRYLVRYPYGCVEQTTSSAFPLLYLADVAAAMDPDTFAEHELDQFVQAGIERLLSMQMPNGGFAMYPGGWRIYRWGTIYATHFLAEARKAGYGVPARALEEALDYIERRLPEERSPESNNAERAYACYVLAVAGRPSVSWTHRLYEQRDEIASYSRFHVAAALALMKEPDLANRCVQIEKLPGADPQRDTGGLLHSSVREEAILLSAYMDVKPAHPHVPALIGRLEKSMKDGRWLTTQENAFALTALGKTMRRASREAPDYQAEVMLDGRRLAAFTHEDKAVLTPEGAGGRTIDVLTKGSGSLYYYWTAEGVPIRDETSEKDHGIKIRRRFLSRDGKALTLDRVPHGEVVVVELFVKSERYLENVVITDLLPAGFEIENPRIMGRDTLPRVGTGHLTPERVEIRDDRLLLFCDLSKDGHYYRYIVRAVTRGDFRLPAVNAFCMYDPGVSSLHGSGRIRIVDAQDKTIVATKARRHEGRR